MIEIEVQNETHQTQERLKFVAVPRIGEGIRLREPDGFWTSYDVVDLWYQKAEFGDIWVPYMHVRITPSLEEPAPQPMVPPMQAVANGPLGGSLNSPHAAPLHGKTPLNSQVPYERPRPQAARAQQHVYGYEGYEEQYPFTA